MNELITSRSVDVTGSGRAERVSPRERGDVYRVSVRVAASLFIGVALLAFWVFLARASTPDVLPGPGAVWLRFIASVRDGSFLPAAGTTGYEAALGWLIAGFVALPLGYAIGRVQLLEDALAPYLAGSQAMPVVAIAPLLLIWLGAGLSSKVAVSALIAFFPMLATTAAGVRSVDREVTDAARVFGAREWSLAWQIYLPLAARAVFSGVKVAAALSVTGAVVGEFIASEEGLGYLVTLGLTNFDPALTFVAVIALIVMGALAYSVVGLAERLVLRWDE